MRVFLGMSIFAVCLTVAGCQGTGRNGRADARPSGNGQQPFLGSPSAGAGSTNLASTNANPTLVRGFLAGQVLDRENRRVPNARIKVFEVDGPRGSAAPLSVLSNREGYFDVGGLEKGRSYRLVAELRDGNRLLTGSTRVQANNSRLVIFLNDEEPIKETPAAAKEPEKPAPAAPPSEGAKTGGPAASLGHPLRSPSDGVTTPLPSAGNPAGTPPAPAASRETDRSLIAGSQDGFTRAVPNPTVTVPSVPGREPVPERPAPYTPPPPPTSRPEDAPGPVPSDAPAPTAAEIPSTSRSVPWCVRIGNRVDDFALHDFDGNIWQYRKERRGKLMLLDFWGTWCTPCLNALDYLVGLQKKYGRFGLQVVGVAYEEGQTIEEKQRRVRPVRVRYRLNYPILFGGASGECPLKRQLEANRFPTLVLLDQNGRILWRHQGHDAHSGYDLEMTIRRELGLPLR